jgi:predicted RNA-binding Zn ribbon-like protein
MMSIAPRRPAALVPAARGDLCLEFANTRFWRGTDNPTETLHRLDDVLAWCARQGALGPPAVQTLKAALKARPAKAQAAFAEAIVLRETIYRIFLAVAAGAGPAEADMAALGRALGRAPGRTTLRRVGGNYVWEVGQARPSVAGALAAVLWSAGDLLAGPRLGRVRRCANDQCQWVFLDESKAGTRRWCSMSACGNRAKAHRHYVKTRKR